MDYAKPYYIFLLLLFIFIILWFFYGQGEYEFIGIKPLNPDYILDYPDASFQGPLSYPSRTIEAIKDNTDRVIELPSLYEEESMKDLCVDMTPNIPPEFVTNICINTNKYLSKGEKICRDTLEKIYGVKFENVRPNWLLNDKTGYPLELDCYNADLKLAIEYQGQQHYKWPNQFHKTYNEFKEQLRRDKLKVDVCQKQGVHLICVPYNINYPLIPQYIIRHLPEIVQKRLETEKL